MLTIKILSYQDETELCHVEIGQSNNFHIYNEGSVAFDDAKATFSCLKSVVCCIDTEGDFKEYKILSNQTAYITDHGGNTVHVI